MRVLHVAPRLSARGGADQCLLGLLAHQAARHELHLLVGMDDGTAVAPARVHLAPGLEDRGDGRVDLADRVHDLRPDAVHVHHVVHAPVLAAAARLDALVTVQDHRAFCPGRGRWTEDGRVCLERMGPEPCAACFPDPARLASRLAATEARLDALRGARLTVLSEYMRGELVRAGVPRAAVHVVPPFVHGLDRAAGPDGPPCVLVAGRLVAAKGVDDAVEAWRRSGVDLPLVFAGTGRLRGRLEAEGHEVLGWLDRARLAATYARARALLLPSRWQEPFGLVGLEALAFGVPVVAFDGGGVRAWHPGDDLLVPWGDVGGLAAALARAVGRRAAPPAGFDPDDLTARTEALYRPPRLGG